LSILFLKNFFENLESLEALGKKFLNFFAKIHFVIKNHEKISIKIEIEVIILKKTTKRVII
jgi:hypothetical protein